MDKPLKDFSVDATVENGTLEFRDQIDKIINLHFFRKLAGKTQVILSLTGPSVRTRLTHTVEVARIARKLCDDLGLNPELAEAIALAHDLGHTPFGHVGERTLKEIMCGCDTLKGKVNETDFVNSGFKHNLQSFRVLSTLEKVSDHDNKWPYILWGVPAHSSMTWSKSYSGMENEILISCKHCDWVYSCLYHEKKECKRNIQEKKKIEAPDFRFESFINGLNCTELCGAIANDGYTLDVSSTPDTIDWLNEVLKSTALYTQIVDKKTLDDLSDDSHKNLRRLRYKYEKSNDLNDLKLLNRFLLQEFYPQKSPKIRIELDNTCQPILCARRETYKLRNEVNEPLQPGEKKGDFIGWFKDRSQIWCNKKCYLAELAAYKIKEENKACVREFPYLFDHPFPNSFYAPDLFQYFGQTDKDYISVEALIVSQADEIAQRQQDLEDAVSMKLIPFKRANQDLNDLIGDSVTANNQKELGEKIVEFYSDQLKKITTENFKSFTEKTTKRMNIYCLMNILCSFDVKDKSKKEMWIIEQIEKVKNNTKIDVIGNFEQAFQLNYTEPYFFLIIYDILDKDIRYGEYDFCRKLLPKLSELFPEIEIDKDHTSEIELIHGLDRLIDVLKDKYKNEYKYFIEPREHKDADDNYWQRLFDLDLYSFHILYQAYLILTKNENPSRNFITIDDLRSIDIESLPKYEVKRTFKDWKKVLKADANRVLGELVKFTHDNDKDAKSRFETFHDNQKDYILKSEMVEKNDGKAEYILKRLFKAYISNSHQLPDDGLNYILLSLTRDMTMDLFVRAERNTFVRLLEKIKKTSRNGFEDIEKIMNKKIVELRYLDFEQVHNPSNEIKALIEKRKKLCKFVCDILQVKTDLNDWINSEDADKIKKIEEARLKFRGILNNPILNAMPYWKSLLTRGICDYIASLTDQQAIDQYEKLYASAMELI